MNMDTEYTTTPPGNWGRMWVIRQREQDEQALYEHHVFTRNPSERTIQNNEWNSLFESSHTPTEESLDCIPDLPTGSIHDCTHEFWV